MNLRSYKGLARPTFATLFCIRTRSYPPRSSGSSYLLLIIYLCYPSLIAKRSLLLCYRLGQYRHDHIRYEHYTTLRFGQKGFLLGCTT
jgi:hypothetical protein